MRKAGQVALWVGAAAVFTIFGAFLAVHRRDVGHFIAGEQLGASNETESTPTQKAPTNNLASLKTATLHEVTESPVPPPQPVEGWKTVKGETVQLSPLDYVALGTASSPSRIKVTIDAEMAVFFGVFQRSTLEELARARRLLRQNDFQQAKCGRVGIVQTEIECEVEADDVLLLRDKRAEGAQLLGAFGFLRGNSQAVNNAAAGNKVRYEIAKWACVQNCDAASGTGSPEEPSR